MMEREINDGIGGNYYDFLRAMGTMMNTEINYEKAAYW